MTEKAIHREINRAHLLFDRLGPALQGDVIISALLKLYQEAGRRTGEIMEQLGISRACTRCALEGEGSCCFPGVENQYDARLLLAALLLGGSLPVKKEIPGRCFFVGKTGCKLPVRHYYCLRFICPELYDTLILSDRNILLEASNQQIALGWELEQVIGNRKWEEAEKRGK
jgi:hypothetical protein